MRLALNLLSRVLDSPLSLLGLVADFGRRLRYRRADLRRLSAAEMIGETAGSEKGFRWVGPVRLRGRSHSALLCPRGSRVTYSVALPHRANVVAWCALPPDAPLERTDEVEFEIHVRTSRSEACARRTIRPRRRWLPERWRLLHVPASESGLARIVFTTRTRGSSPGQDVGAFWGDLCIETPRPARDLVSTLHLAMTPQRVRSLLYRVLPPSEHRLYRTWIRTHEPVQRELRAQRQWSTGQRRLCTLITLVQEPESWRPGATGASVLAQSYPGWEWLLIVPEETTEQVTALAAGLLEDQRIRLVCVPSGRTRADAWNTALEEGRGEFAGILDDRDTLSPDALFQLAQALERLPNSDVVYCDEDRIEGEERQRHSPGFKPDWSPELLLSRNYVGRLAMMRVATVRAVGGFLPCGGNEEWELLLRLARSGARIRRLPLCLYHRHGTAPGTDETSAIMVRDHCQELGLHADVTTVNGVPRVVWAVQGQPVVSIIIPNRDAATVFTRCVTGLMEHTSYQSWELIVVDNGSTDVEVLEMYRALEGRGRGRIVPFARPFNFSAACNAGAAVARGDLFLFLNNDIEVIQQDWLEELIRWAQRPEIGVVGAKLLYPDRSIQHAGIVFGLGFVGHIFSRAAEGTSGLFGSTDCYRNYLAVTGACQMLRRDVFERVGGYDERFRVSFSDVVLCMEAWGAGYRIVYTPNARLVHHESFTRDREDSQEDLELLARYLQKVGFVEDPYFHPELDAKSPIPALRVPFDPAPPDVVRDRIGRVLAAARLTTG